MENKSNHHDGTNSNTNSLYPTPKEMKKIPVDAYPLLTAQRLTSIENELADMSNKVETILKSSNPLTVWTEKLPLTDIFTPKMFTSFDTIGVKGLSIIELKEFIERKRNNINRILSTMAHYIPEVGIYSDVGNTLVNPKGFIKKNHDLLLEAHDEGMPVHIWTGGSREWAAEELAGSKILTKVGIILKGRIHNIMPTLLIDDEPEEVFWKYDVVPVSFLRV